MIKLLGKTPDELKKIAVSVGLPAFSGKQISQWLYQKKVTSVGEMTNLSKEGRERLSAIYEVGKVEASDCMISTDGTKKYLFPVECTHIPGLNKIDTAQGTEKSSVEAVMIPDNDRSTLCVSSQAGCKMGCHFCMTGFQGFHGHLSAADIINQFISIDETDKLTNAVFMGMGEPLDNYDNVLRSIEILTSPWGFGWSPKRITLSTIGVLPRLKQYLEDTKCHIAISMHSPFDEEREAIMPVQKVYPIRDIINLLKNYDFSGQRRVSFEYTMFAGLNDDKRNADAIIRLLRGMECRVNLIRFHKIPTFPYEAPIEPVMEMFRDRLSSAGITSTIRASRGEDIFAACGMLAGTHKNEKV